MKWFSDLRRAVNAPYRDVELSPDEALWWTEECRRTRWRRWTVTLGQSLAAAFGPSLPGIINAPDQHVRLVAVGFASALTVGVFAIFGTLNDRVQLRIARKERLPRYRLRQELLAELQNDSGTLVTETSPAGRLERHDVA